MTDVKFIPEGEIEISPIGKTTQFPDELKPYNKGQLSELRDTIAEKVQSYDPKADVEEAAEFDTTEQLGFFEFIGKYRSGKDTVILWTGCIGAALFGLTLPGFNVVFAELIDDVGSSAGGMMDTDSLKKQAWYMIYIGLFAWLCSFFQVGLYSMFSESLSFKIRINYFKRCLEQDAAFYDEHNPTEMASKISKECGAIQRGTGDKVGFIVMSVASFFSGFAFAFIWGWKLTLILMVMVPVFIFVGAVFTLVLESGVTAEMKAYSQSAGYAEQALQAIKVVQTYGNELLELETYKKFLHKTTVIQSKNQLKASLGKSATSALLNVFYAYAFYFGGKFIDNQKDDPEEDREYTGGDIMGILFCVLFGAFYLGGASAHVTAVTDAKIGGKLAFEVIDHKPQVDPNAGGMPAIRQNIRGKIEFKNVKFSYPSNKDLKILKDFTQVFEAGKTTALVGPSGSGKSTIIQLVERFYNPNSGEITIDGTNIASYDLRSLRQFIGYVSQEPILFNASIKENMLFAKPDATDAEIEEALRDANAWDFIKQKMGSEGIHAQVGGAGGKLSGGQKQRIAIARAFIKKPKVLLLDEATSALDSKNEKMVQDAIDRYRQHHGDITIIVVAHRLSTIRDADKIVVMRYGEIKEVGNHQSLLEDFPEGIYADFCKKQEQGNEPDEDEDPMSGRADALEDELNEKAVSAPATEVKKTRVVTKTKIVEGRQITESVVEVIDDQTLKMTELVNKVDEKEDNRLAELKQKAAETSAYSKLMPYNRPLIYVFLAIICAILNGAVMPIFGVILSRLLGALTVPPEFYEMYFNESEDDSLMHRVNKNVIYMVIVSVAGLIFSTISKACFGILGTNVTLKMRQELYEHILRKNFGWFDDRENSTGILTAAMAKDTAVVNGASSESLGPVFEAAFAMIIGIAIGFYYCWQEAIVCILTSPVMMVGQILEAKLQEGFAGKTSEMMKESDLLCGDAISNYKTVQSFGNDDLVVQKYKDMIEPILGSNMKKHLENGFMYGFTQFGQFFVISAMFYAAGIIMDNNMDEVDEDGKPKLDPTDVFTAVFALLFAAIQAGMAASFGPDMGKANAAATRIFGIIDTPSRIDAVAQENEGKVRISNPDSIRGEIEFRNVWFRYPTRKEDFVLRGLNIKISSNEKVALVGESGCGKSTFVNLLMRFYDVDYGEVLLDGRNIREYNLHDLRKAISLVMQEPIIFNYSILENILYGAPNVSNTQVKEASDISNCTEFVEHADFFDFDDSAHALLRAMKAHEKELTGLIGEEKYKEEIEVLEKLDHQEQAKGEFLGIEGIVDQRSQSLKDIILSNGFKTQCGIRGGKLSGGQKQRVAIARTIIRKPKVLLLDEATSALDEDNQKKVQKALDNAMEGRTTIIIAHRMSTIQNCSKIFVLQDGRVLEEGGFDELQQKGGFFAKISLGGDQKK